MRNRFAPLMMALVLLLLPGLALAENPAITNVTGLKGAVLMEPATVTRLWAQDGDARLSVAGLTKLPAILTLCQAFDEGLLSESAEMRVSTRSAGIPGPSAFLSAGETMPARALVKAAVMISAGDAIMTLGENAFGSDSVFVENINVTLRQIGLSARMTDALGTGMTFSSWDLAMLGKAAMASKTFSAYCCLYLDSITHPDGRETELVNANRLVKNYAGCRGLMTGSSAEDGYCGVFSASRGGTDLIAVVVGSENAVKRTAAAVGLLDYGFAAFKTQTLSSAGEVVKEALPVRDGDVKAVDLVARDSVRVVTKVDAGTPSITEVLPEELAPPLMTDVSVGSLEYRDGKGALLAAVPLYPACTVRPFGIKDILLRIIGVYCA